MRALEECVYFPLFPGDSDEAINAYKLLTSATVMVHRFGFFVFLLELQRLSGESMTSIANGLINAFNMWVAQGEPPLNLFLGLFEGDDGLVPELPGVNYVATASLFGFELTLVPHVNYYTANFCGRYLTHRGSMCDFMRTISKFHLSSNSSFKREQLLKAKSLSYLATDYHTPVIGAMCWAFVQRLHKVIPRFDHDMHLRRFLADTHVSVFNSIAPPSFDREVAYQMTWIFDISFHSLESLHHSWLSYGRGLNPRFVTIENPHGSSVQSIVSII